MKQTHLSTSCVSIYSVFTFTYRKIVTFFCLSLKWPHEKKKSLQEFCFSFYNFFLKFFPLFAQTGARCQSLLLARVSAPSLPAFSMRLARLSPAKQLVCFYCLAVCNITCSVTVGCVPCKHSPLISALFFFVQARQRCLSDSFAC